MRLSLAPVGSAPVANCTVARMVTTIGIDAAATRIQRAGEADSVSRPPQRPHRRRDHEHGEQPQPAHGVFEVRAEDARDRHDREQPGDAEQRVQVQLGRGPSRSGDRTAIPHRTSRPTNPTTATTPNESRPGPNTHGPNRLSWTTTISATSPSPRYGPSGWRKLSIRIDRLPGERRSWSTSGGNQATSSGEQRQPGPDRESAAIVAPALPHHHGCHRSEHPDDDQQVPGVGLDAVRAGQHGHRERPQIALEHAPQRQHEHEEREQAHPRVPRLGEHVGPPARTTTARHPASTIANTGPPRRHASHRAIASVTRCTVATLTMSAKLPDPSTA